MSTMSDFYINICLRVTGKNLLSEKANPLIGQYNDWLKELRVEEQREDGKIFKFWAINVDEYKHELLSKDVLICSRRVRFEVRDPLPHGDNRANFIQAKIHKKLMELKVESDEIVIETIGTHITGNSRTGRWPKDELDRAFQ